MSYKKQLKFAPVWEIHLLIGFMSMPVTYLSLAFMSSDNYFGIVYLLMEYLLMFLIYYFFSFRVIYKLSFKYAAISFLFVAVSYLFYFSIIIMPYYGFYDAKDIPSGFWAFFVIGWIGYILWSISFYTNHVAKKLLRISKGEGYPNFW